jgi:hypothetical protein
VEKLSLNPEFKAVLGKKILIIWLKYKIFDALDILKGSEATKRMKVSEAIGKFDLDSSDANIDELIRICMSSIEADEADLLDVK